MATTNFPPKRTPTERRLYMEWVLGGTEKISQRHKRNNPNVDYDSYNKYHDGSYGEGTGVVRPTPYQRSR